MTEVEKVSIGGYAFTLEVEAYAIVKQYLEELEAYYGPLEGGAEVMEGFEERMAELLYEKCADDGVASVAEVREIIETLGKPSSIEAESEPEPRQKDEPETDKKKPKRRLYRDPTNKMVGGVCSGLAAYFRCDVVLVRIIFIGLTVLGFVISYHSRHIDNLGLFAPLVYLICWIAMPEARTVKQRWEMGVMNPPAGAAAAAGTVAAPTGQPVGSGLGRVLRILIGCLLLLMAICGLTIGLTLLFGYTIFDWDILNEIKDEIAFHAPGALPLVSTLIYRISVLSVCFLPFVGMLYGGIMMIFDLRSPRWRPGLVIFLLWIIALTVFTVLTVMGLFHAEMLGDWF